MISDDFGNKGIDRNYDGILQQSEIDIKARGTMGGFGIPHTALQESGQGSDAMVGVQKPMFGGCFDVSMPTPKYLPKITDEFSCVYGEKTDNTWSYDVETSQPQCKNKSGVILPKSSLSGDNFPVSNPASNKEYKINCEYTKSGITDNVWREDYLRPSDFKEKTLSSVLDKINNGRVPDIDIFEEVKVKQSDIIMNNDNQETAVKGIVEETALSKYFFSKENFNANQQTIRYQVYQSTNEYIDNQSEKDLYIVMRSVLLQHANFKVSSQGLLDEIRRLNRHVVKYCVNEISSNVMQYKGYLKDLEKLPLPLDRPSFNEAGSRNRTYDLSNHIAPVYNDGWASRHTVNDDDDN